jgi:SnoaL-like polyketide cyclase
MKPFQGALCDPTTVRDGARARADVMIPMQNTTHAVNAKAALEQVCSGIRVAGAPDYYSSQFVDHVNGTEYRGHEGIRRSVERYSKLLSNLHIEVKDQLIDTDRVTSRFRVTGRCYGRGVSFDGITISRFEGDLIVEDWTVTDILGMLKGLGVWRSLLVALRS